MILIPAASLNTSGGWSAIRASLDDQVPYYELKDATPIIELALWKARIGQTDDPDHEACRMEVPGPVKDAILQYL